MVGPQNRGGRVNHIKKSGIKYHYTKIYRNLRKWGFKQKVPRKVHVNIVHLWRKKRLSKKDRKNIYGCETTTTTTAAAAAAAGRWIFRSIAGRILFLL